MKKVIMAAAVLCLGLLLWIGCLPSGETGAYLMLGPYGLESSTYCEVYFPDEDFMPSSSRGKTGTYFMLGIFGRWIGGRFMPEFPDWDSLIPSSGEETGEDLYIELSDEEEEEILDELTEFCKDHREKLNEMSEYFINALEDVSDYNDRKNLPDIDELANALPDAESKEILEKLDPYYPRGIDYSSRLKQVSYIYSYDYDEEYVTPLFRVEYIKADEGKLKSIFCGDGYIYTWRRIDKYLYAVKKIWPCE